MTTKTMDLNHETAMRLWVKSFGKETKVKDFAGREIAKGAYNDRNSQYGWNVDHVLPQSKGGTTADYNLVCCNIKTNDEKADKFPCFNANGKRFEIIKVQNHYEIKPIVKAKSQEKQLDDELNFYDSASGLRYFKKLKGVQNKKRWVGSVLIRLDSLTNNAVVDFIETLFENENVSFMPFNKLSSYEIPISDNDISVCVLIKNYDMPLKDDIADLLDKCVLLNTYMSSYFLQLSYFRKFEIDYAVTCYEKKLDMYHEDVFRHIGSGIENSLFINGNVIENTEAKERVQITNGGFTNYDYVYTQLSKNLKKEVEGK